jgi:regulator of sigma E protease
MDICLADVFLLAATKSFWLNPASWWAMAQVLIGLGAVIFVHELGHFLVAKMCGVKCDKFYVGFDAFDIKIGDRVIVPRSLVKYQWGETEYGIGILPLGGYVKMLGQDDNPQNMEQEIERSKIADGDSTSDAIDDGTGIIDREDHDPRSFLAKSVPQRMAIISAGVIFNLIFAVLFAAIAFKSGVDYTPPMIGSVIGGGPAWENGLAGGEIRRIGDSTVDGYYTFMDAAQEVVFSTDENPVEFEYIPYGETESKAIEITPRKGFMRDNPDLALLGFQPRSTPVIGESGTVPGTAAAAADPAIEPKDRIVEVAGIPIKTDIDLRRALNLNSEKTVEFVLEREIGNGETKTTKRIVTSVDPNPMRVVGFAVQWLPISALQSGSPGEAAGLQIGDEIISIDGQPRGDLLTLDRRMITVARDEGSVKLEIKRDGKTSSVSITPVVPNLIAAVGPNQPVAIDSLGIAVPITATMESITPGTPAADANIKPGDELVSVTYKLSEEQQKNDAYSNLKRRLTIHLVDNKTNWPELFKNLQVMEIGTELELSFRRGDDEVTTTVKTAASEDFFQETRGITITALQKHYVSETWSDAFKNGYRQVVNDIKRVGKTLVTLIRGKISPTNLGGPGTIALAATSEATRGTSRLLLFLTFLSANLAIVNFLPIPILDGGHMLFLAYEGIFRRPVSEKVQVLLTYVGLAMILALMLFVVSLDIGRIGSLL